MKCLTTKEFNTSSLILYQKKRSKTNRLILFYETAHLSHTIIWQFK